LTFEVMYVSVVRAENELVGPTTSSFCTMRTFGIDRTICVTSFFEASVGTSPVSSAMPL
jgi:hypothetical protein